MDSCVATLSDMMGLLMAESHYRLSLGIEWLDSTVRVIDSVGLVSHIAGYISALFVVVLLITVWRMTRNRAPMHH